MQILCSNLSSNGHYAVTKEQNQSKKKGILNTELHRQSSSHNNLCFLASPVNVIVAAAILALSSHIAYPPSTLAESSISKGAALFQKACIGCHDMGGNILQPGATLFTKDLERNGIATDEEIYNITYYGKGRMPGFGEKCAPRGQCTFGPRLQEDEIKMLAEFVRLQADKGWPRIESYEEQILLYKK